MAIYSTGSRLSKKVEFHLWHFDDDLLRRLRCILIVTAITLILGCERPPQKSDIVGLWVPDPEKIADIGYHKFWYEFRPDGTCHFHYGPKGEAPTTGTGTWALGKGNWISITEKKGRTTILRSIRFENSRLIKDWGHPDQYLDPIEFILSPIVR